MNKKNPTAQEDIDWLMMPQRGRKSYQLNMFCITCNLFIY